MLENIRESSQGMTAKIILGLIILTFAVAGLGSYSNSADTSVATVNGEKISQQEFNKAYQAQRNRMAQQFGDMFDTLSNDSNYMANFRQGVLDNLINERLIDQNADSLALRVSDEQLKKTIREMPEFQVDGIFDNNRYLAIINQSGFFQSSNFRDYLRVEMIRRQLSQALVSTEFNLPYQEKLQLALQNQTRDIRFATISAKQFEAGIDVSEEEIKTYYQANQIRFENKEQVKVDYISLNVADIAKDINVTDEELNQYYQENITAFTQNEQRRIAHILIEFADDETAAREQTETLLTRINAGEDFATLAKEFSADVFSGEQGGDLDWIERGVMDVSFDDGAFALTEVGSVSVVVKSEFGFHIIKLTDLKAEQTTALSEIEAEVKAKVSNEKAQDKFFELQQEMARLSFEFPDSLEDAADGINGVVKSSAWLSRTGNLAPFDSPKAVEAAFSDLVLTEQLNSDLIEVNDNLAIVMRLDEYQAANVKALTEVSAQINLQLITQKASEKSQALAEEVLSKFQAGEDILAQLTDVGASFEIKSDIARYGSDVDNNIAKQAFTLPHPQEGGVSATSVTLSNGDIAIVEVQNVTVGTADDNANFAQQQTSQLAQSAYKSFVDSLMIDAKVTRKTIAAPTNVY